MKYPNLERDEPWEKKKERVFNDLREKGEKFINEHRKKLEKLEKNKHSF